MTALVNTLDNYTLLQIGEKGHTEYGWSNCIQELILQYSFQLTRTNEFEIENLKDTLKTMLASLKRKIESATAQHEKDLLRGYLSILYRMIGHTRDIIDGKGEYALTYMMIYTWYDFYPELAKFALKCIVDLDNVHQYGSWKDIKYFCEYCRSQGENKEHILIKYAVELINKQLREDNTKCIYGSNDLSLVAKWIPRESSSFGWLYKMMATDYFPEYMDTPFNTRQHEKALLKCKTQYRKIISKLNSVLDTLQIKQCTHNWSSINFDNVTSISLSKQKKAFLNVKKNGEIRYPENVDRIECSENFNFHIQKVVKGLTEMKGKRVGMADFTKQAIELLKLDNRSRTETMLLNSQWRDNSSQNGALGKMIAMVDVSASMEGDPMNVAIALGIRIAEKSVLGKRIMTFSSKPTWINLEGHDDFVAQVGIIKNAEWGMNTNFYAALDLILDAIILNKMEPDDVQDMVLIILSDMQIDTGDRCNKQTLYDTMKTKYEAAGIRVHGKPYKPPHILFWNLRSTTGFPSLSNQENVSMMSGFSPALLNLFCEQGISSLESCTPWSLLQRSLENERYKIMGDKLITEIQA
jgi:hypothetical protein